MPATPTNGPLTAEIRSEADRARTTPAPELTFTLWRRFADTGDRRAYERAYFERRRRLAALVLAAHLDDRPDPALDDLLWSVCDERTWVLPAHEPENGPPNAFVDLFAAETGHTLAEATVLLGEHLDPRVRARVREEVERRIFRPLDESTMWWESATHNWSAVCAGAIGMAALALGSDHLLPRVRKALEVFLMGTGPDGACLEGPDYWSYGFGYFVYFAEALREHTGEDLLDDPHVREMAAYPARIDLGDGTRPAFADSHAHGVYPAGLLSRLTARLGVPTPPPAAAPSFHDDPCYRWAHLSRTLWWSGDGPHERMDAQEAADAERSDAPEVADAERMDAQGAADAERSDAQGAADAERMDLPGIADAERTDAREGADAEPYTYLPDAAIVVARASGLAFAAKGGHNDEPHNHLDLGHFILHAHGRTVLDDFGAPEYTRDYFREGRYQMPQASAEWHSIPLIDGTAQQPGRAHHAEVLEHTTTPDSLTFALDLTPAYTAPALTRFTRAFHWRPGTLELVDTFGFTTADALVEELFVSRLRPEPLPDRVLWGPVELAVPAGWQARAEEREVRGHDGEKETIHRVRLTARVPPGTHHFVFTVADPV
ncbi:hypothetical protein [Nonomuraea insulae]|uniref:Heparinase II/III-like protein n=1 Tax=Nonomuraea insulae TaxID=1616787 RepID=A0ABW1CSU5_9ACTN